MRQTQRQESSRLAGEPRITGIATQNSHHRLQTEKVIPQPNMWEFSPGHLGVNQVLSGVQHFLCLSRLERVKAFRASSADPIWALPRHILSLHTAITTPKLAQSKRKLLPNTNTTQLQCRSLWTLGGSFPILTYPEISAQTQQMQFSSFWILLLNLIILAFQVIYVQLCIVGVVVFYSEKLLTSSFSAWHVISSMLRKCNVTIQY